MKISCDNSCCVKKSNFTTFKASLEGTYPSTHYFEKVADNFSKQTSKYPNHSLHWSDYYLHPEHFLLIKPNGSTSFHTCSNENYRLIKSQSEEQLTKKLVNFFNTIIKNK